MVPDLVQPDEEIRSKCHKVLKDLSEVLTYLTGDVPDEKLEKVTGGFRNITPL